jgi:thioredoxin reductase (NADPH)
MREWRDCIIVGGGPAGMTAAIYLARFHLSVAVIDKGGGRARSIPCARNVPGFVEGIPGAELVGRMWTQAASYGAETKRGVVNRLERIDGGFSVSCQSLALAARTVLIATGVTNRCPPGMDGRTHDAALALGLIRYCPICDGYEVSDKRVAVLGQGAHGLREAEFLRSYTNDVTLVGLEEQVLRDDTLLRRAQQASIEVLAGPLQHVSTGRDFIQLDLPSGQRRFDTLYPALGSTVRSELAHSLGAAVTAEGCITVDRHQRTSIPGLYAAGDVVLGLDQISHAMGEGGVASTAIRNDLAEMSPLLR